MKDTFILATIGSPFGLDGFVKVRSLSGEIDHLLKLEKVTVVKDGKEQVLEIKEVSSSPLAMRFAGIDSPEKAKTFAGVQIVAGREQAVPLKKGEFYIEDLKGLTVFSEKGEEIGKIVDIVEGGGGELAEIELFSQKGSGEKRLVPFRKEFFPEILPEKCKVILQNDWILE